MSEQGARIAKVSVTHEAIMDWMVLNPEKSMRECAGSFGYTQAWLSSIVNSAAFRARLAEKRGEILSVVALGLPEKLTGIAHAALDNLARELDRNGDAELAMKAADLALRGLGVGAKTGGVTLNMTSTGPVQQIFASQADLEAARRLIAPGVGQRLPVLGGGGLGQGQNAGAEIVSSS